MLHVSQAANIAPALLEGGNLVHCWAKDATATTHFRIPICSSLFWTMPQPIALSQEVVFYTAGMMVHFQHTCRRGGDQWKGGGKVCASHCRVDTEYVTARSKSIQDV